MSLYYENNLSPKMKIEDFTYNESANNWTQGSIAYWQDLHHFPSYKFYAVSRLIQTHSDSKQMDDVMHVIL